MVWKRKWISQDICFIAWNSFYLIYYYCKSQNMKNETEKEIAWFAFHTIYILVSIWWKKFHFTISIPACLFVRIMIKHLERYVWSRRIGKNPLKWKMIPYQFHDDDGKEENHSPFRSFCYSLQSGNLNSFILDRLPLKVQWTQAFRVQQSIV